MNVTVEFADPQHPARAVACGVMKELRRRVRTVVDQMEVRDPAVLTEQLVLLIDGAFSAAQVMDKDAPTGVLVAAADALIEAQLIKK
jgi:hypothetical protein